MIQVKNRFAFMSLLLAGIVAPAAPAISAAPVAQTHTGIQLDAPWKQKLYAFAQEKLKHPAWGWAHSERDYRLALEIAGKERLQIDTDVLFAAAFVHDIGAIGEFQKDDMDHADRSAELAGPLLQRFGFPPQKIPAVKEAILGHMHDRIPGKRRESIVLHDADTIDFLGTVGVVRRISATGSAPDYSAGLTKIRDFTEKLPSRLITRSAKQMARPRVAEMRRLVAELDAETFEGQLP